MKKYTTLLRLPEDVKGLLESAKAITGKSQHQLILEAIQEALGGYPATQLTILDRLDKIEAQLSASE
ncbi:hypothetical protein ANSO36C_07210 [Nostoc cf. commune SO-36]|uniref:Ribbon-helix-helix protein CopG domain-containing protein n=1 Tax=Nostoc cf. commune SO-36 TaxID=449208 RepID=A0ABM7YWB2_NOSCO|nr:hypothetical protein [Nostoc commune]BDI14919.1 hypothetical protein ANSO36C_07210 [Nostoc cf. commune SO-36]